MIFFPKANPIKPFWSISSHSFGKLHRLTMALYFPHDSENSLQKECVQSLQNSFIGLAPGALIMKLFTFVAMFYNIGSSGHCYKTFFLLNLRH